MQEIEIEKRYLVPADKIAALKSQADASTATYMNDFYIPNGDQHKSLRLRQKGDKYMVTRKRPAERNGLQVMIEETLALSPEEFAALTSGITTNVEKTRYLIKLGDYEGELDIFSGRHEDLAVLEIEFPDEASFREFASDATAGLVDITGLEWLASGRLAETSTSELSDRLATLLP